MIAKDEDAFICDMAETYGVLDYRSLPVSLLCTLASGLPTNSRSVRRMNEMPVSEETMLLTAIFDKLNILLWRDSKDGQKGRNKPKELLSMIMNSNKEKEEVITFSSPEEFNNARAEIIN